MCNDIVGTCSRQYALDDFDTQPFLQTNAFKEGHKTMALVPHIEIGNRAMVVGYQIGTSKAFSSNERSRT